MEMKQQELFCDRLRRETGMDQALYVNPVGISGGITIWWMNDMTLTFSHISKNIIDCEAQLGLNGGTTKITWIYGDPNYR